MNKHTIHVFYSGEDKLLYATVPAVLRQLQLLQKIWTKCPGADGIALDLHDTAEESFELTPELVAAMASGRDTIVILITPQVMLGKGMLDSEAHSALKANLVASTNILLCVYCEQVVCAQELSQALGGLGWIYSAQTGRWLSQDKSANDAAADAAKTVRDVLERKLSNRLGA